MRSWLLGMVVVVGCDRAALDELGDAAVDSVDVPGAIDAGVCPVHMVAVAGAGVCIDAYEGALEELASDGAYHPASPYQVVGNRIVRAVPAAGIPPQGYISGVEAKRACEAAGKRLCSSTEWLAACRGSTNRMWPYGNAHVDGACNDHYAGHPVVNFFGTAMGVFDSVHMNNPGINQQPNSLAAGGQFAACVSEAGAFDLHGNLHEWVADEAGTFRGGFYADAKINGEGCTYRTTAHDFTYHDYSTGFRCCSTLQTLR